MIRALALIAFCSLACGKQTFLAAAFIQTPQLPNPTNPSGNIPPLQVMTAYFGTIDTTNPTQLDASKEAPIIDADASVAFIHGGTDPRWLKDHWSQADGTYTLTSSAEPLLTFEPNTPYTLMLLTREGEAFGARFVPGPAADIQEFLTAHCDVTLPPPLTSYSTPRCVEGALATIHRTDTATNGDLLPAFVLVGKFDPKNPSAEPQITYKTVPDTADKLLKFVLSDRDYRKPSFDIPSSAYTGSGYYIVSLVVVKHGKVSGNAFLGSTALSGSGSAGIVHIP